MVHWLLQLIVVVHIVAENYLEYMVAGGHSEYGCCSYPKKDELFSFHPWTQQKPK